MRWSERGERASVCVLKDKPDVLFQMGTGHILLFYWSHALLLYVQTLNWLEFSHHKDYSLLLGVTFCDHQIVLGQ